MVPKTRGRPTVYSGELADAILSRLAEGQSLRNICSEPCMPPHPTVLEWVKDNRGADENGRDGFADRYMRARSAGYQLWAEELIAIGDDPCLFNGVPDNVLVQRARLMSDNRKWLLSKLLPRQFGDRVVQELVGDSDRPLVSKIELVAVVPAARLPKSDDETVQVAEAATMPLRAIASR